MHHYRHTIYASYIGYVTQAIVNTLAPLLFLIFQREFNIPLERLTLLFTFNFLTQLVVDFITAKVADKIGYRTCLVAAHIFTATGLVGFGVFPHIFGDPFFGLVLSVIFNAIGGGIIEVLVTPIVEACPTENKTAETGVLHSFYCWGVVGVILLSTLFLNFAGQVNWRLLTCLWAVIPAANAVYFGFVPICQLNDECEGMSLRELFSHNIFWLLFLMMLTAGASELSINQWSSAFAESALGVSKTIGDIAGPCFIAITQGIARILYSKFGHKVDLLSLVIGSSALCVLSYLIVSLSPYPVLAFVGCGLCGLSVGILWPCVLNIAPMKLPRGGTAMFGFLAIAGDAGGSAGPTFVGMIAGAFGDNISVGLLCAVIFPILLITVTSLCKKATKKQGI